MTQQHDASGAGRTPQPPSPSPSGPSFARRHPFYAAFGVLAALSLFSAFWPVSAIVTGAIVAARATGLDKLAWQGALNAGGWLRARVSGRGVPVAAPPQPQPAMPARERAEPSVSPRAARIGTLGEPDSRAVVARHPGRSPEPAGAGAHERGVEI